MSLRCTIDCAQCTRLLLRMIQIVEPDCIICTNRFLNTTLAFPKTKSGRRPLADTVHHEGLEEKAVLQELFSHLLRNGGTTCGALVVLLRKAIFSRITWEFQYLVIVYHF